MQNVTLRNSISIVSLILGTLTLTSLSTQKAEASWNAAACKLKCSKTVLANRSSKDFDKNVNNCAANCDNTKIKETLLAFCKTLDTTNKANLQKMLEEEKRGYEKAIQDNQKNITRLENATSPRERKYFIEYQTKSKALADKVNKVTEQMQKCGMTPISTSGASTALSDKEKQLLSALTTKENEHLNSSNSAGMPSDSKQTNTAAKDGGFVSATPGLQATKSANAPQIGHQRSPAATATTKTETGASPAFETFPQHTKDMGQDVVAPIAPPPPPPPPQPTTKVATVANNQNQSTVQVTTSARTGKPASTPGTPRGNLLAEIESKPQLRKVEESPNSKVQSKEKDDTDLKSVLSKAMSQRRGALAGKSEPKTTPQADDDEWK